MGLFSRFWHCISEKQMPLGVHGDCFQGLLQKPKICGCPSLPTKQHSVCIRPAHAPLYFSLPLHLLKYLIKHKSRYKYSLVSIFSGTWLVQTELLFRNCLLILDWIQRHRTHGWQMATALLVLSPGRSRETVRSPKAVPPLHSPVQASFSYWNSGHNWCQYEPWCPLSYKGEVSVQFVI